MKSFSMLLMLASFFATSGLAGVQSYSTGGKTAYHVRPAKVDGGGKRAIISATYDGCVLCHDENGQLLWQSPTEGCFPFDLDVGDIDGDGFDESLVASADGALYAFDHDGSLLWRFAKEPPLYQAGIVHAKSGAVVILAGGIERILYAFSPAGRVLAQIPMDDVVRVISPGHYTKDGGETVAVVTAKNGRDGFQLQLFDPEYLEPLWEKEVDLTASLKGEARVRAFSAIPLDLDGDALDEIVMSVSTGTDPSLAAYDGQGNRIHMKSGRAGKKRPYRMNLLAAAREPASGDQCIVGLFGAELIVYGLDGRIRSFHYAPGTFANIAFDWETNSLLFGSDISGGDGIHILPMKSETWTTLYENMKPMGKIAQIQRNLAELADQTRRFTPPAYQPSARPVMAIVQQSPEEVRQTYHPDENYQNVLFASYVNYLEHYDPGITNPKWRKEWESRHSSGLTSKEDIVAAAHGMEAAGEDFVVWAGHGRLFGIDFYISLETIEQLLEAAPKTLKGFVFAELEQTNEAARNAIVTQLVPMAEMCRQHGDKKILLRNKNIFWNGTCYTPTWCDVLLEGKYRDIFVPSMEETNCRTQELSLSGREGLWLTQKFSHLSARAVTDNACYTRCWEWGQQQTLSHFIRSLAYQASLGADILHINLYAGDYRDMIPLFDLLEKGALLVPKRDEILSISDVCLSMRAPSPSFLEHGTNGHGDSSYAPGETPAVFNRLDCYWGGTPIPPYDFTALAFGSRRRMLNFLPPTSFGLVCTVPDDVNLAEFPPFKARIRTDGEFYYDEAGAKYMADEYGPVVEKTLQEAARRMPVLVQGEVASSAVRLDAGHLRVTLFDSGYLDPADRAAAVILQGLKATSCRDILANEPLPIENGTVRLVVPMGSMRILDVQHE